MDPRQQRMAPDGCRSSAMCLIHTRRARDVLWCGALFSVRGASMKRREFISSLGGAAVAWPLAAQAQPRDGMRRIGFLAGLPADDPEGQARLAAFRQGLAQWGWSVGRDFEMDYRAAGRDPDRYRKYAQEV